MVVCQLRLRDNVCASGGFGIAQDVVVGIKFYFREIEQIIRPTASYHLWLSNRQYKQQVVLSLQGWKLGPVFLRSLCLLPRLVMAHLREGKR